jgi:predicted nuclease with TOPRIM domain
MPASVQNLRNPRCALDMKRILLPLALVVAVSAQAQITTNPKVKVDPKNNKVSNPVVEKPKAKLMSRDDLRACIDQQETNGKEAEAIKVEQAAYKSNADSLKTEKATIEAGEAALGKQITDMKAEKESIVAAHAALTADASKLDKAELKARNEAYQARVNNFNTMFEAVKAADAEQSAKRKAFGDKVDALDAQFKALEDRTEKHFDANDKWKAECSNKAYDENDEKAIRKERAAAGK